MKNLILKGETRLSLFALSLLLGMLVAGTYNIFSMMFGHSTSPFSEEWSIMIVHVIIASIPFFILAVLGIRFGSAWIVGIAVTVLLWGYALFDAIFRTEGGANIGLGLIMMVGPIAIAILCVIVAWKADQAK
jgi:hypothetical protein